MSTNGTPPPTWPIEPTTRYLVYYFENDSINETPVVADTLLYDYNGAVARAKELITENNNQGVCIISIASSVIVYPSVAWVDF